MSRKTIDGKSKAVLYLENQMKLITKDTEISRLKALVKKYEERLEIDHAFRHNPPDFKREKFFLTDKEKETFPDAVTCRDATIKFLEMDVDEQAVIIGKAIDLIYAEMGKSIGWDRELIPNYMKPLFDALEKADHFIDLQPDK